VVSVSPASAEALVGEEASSAVRSWEDAHFGQGILRVGDAGPDQEPGALRPRLEVGQRPFLRTTGCGHSRDEKLGEPLGPPTSDHGLRLP
jgi:hypothetical protein